MTLKPYEIVHRKVAEVLRTKTPAERLAMGFECDHLARVMIQTQLQSRHPEWTEDQVSKEVARRFLSGAG